jgi:hypothetical protein
MEPEPVKLQALKQKLQEKDTVLYNNILPLLKAYQESTATTEQYAAIREFYYKRRYILRLQEQIHNFARS